MKYYLVALMDRDSSSYVENIQRGVCKKFKAYRNQPAPHITLEVVGDPDVEKLSRIINDMLKPYKKFRAEINGTISVDAPRKIVNLRVENKGYIIRLARNFNDKLKLHGFSVRDGFDKMELNIPLANINYSNREIMNREYMAAGDSSKKENQKRYVKIDRVELWKSINSKREVVIKSFPLKDF